MKKIKFLSLIAIVFFLSGCKTTITTSQEDVAFIPENGTVRLVGTGEDNSGDVAGSELVWVSNVDGNLGTGNTLEIPASDLTLGEHVITLQFKSNNGSAENDSINITIRPLKYVCVRKEAYQRGDDTLDQITEYDYASTTGNVIMEKMLVRNLFSDEMELEHHVFYSYNINVLLRVETVESGDSAWEYYTHDDDGRVATIESVDGDYKKTDIYSYDEKGNKIKIEEDFASDGIVDEVAYYTYDEFGNKLSAEYDWHPDGKIDTRKTYENTYNANNQLTEKVYKTYEFNSAGEEELNFSGINYYTWDANGNMIKTEQDYHMNGVMDHYYTYAYELR